MARKRRIAIITCYPDPDYIRAKTLREGLSLLPNVQLIIVKNTMRNMLRYPEILMRVFFIRIRYNPDVYLLTFRGYEILPFVLLLAYPKPVVFDEFISLINWLVHEHRRLPEKGILTRVIRSIYRLLLQRCSVILSDTTAHALSSATLLDLKLQQYVSVPVSTDEKMFYPQTKTRENPDRFLVFYYGNMLPLHGISYVIESALALRKYPDIEFLLVGGDKKVKQLVDNAIEKGANIIYKKWIPFAEIPDVIASVDLCLGGPFGNTKQSDVVITGKTYQFLASGKAVLIGKNKVTHRFIDYKDSLLVKQGSSKDLTEKIFWAYKNKSKLERIGYEGRKTYEKYFSNHHVTASLKLALASFLVG